MCQLPEPGVLADAILDQEMLQKFAALGAEEDHGLVQSVEDRRTGRRALQFLPTAVGLDGNLYRMVFTKR